MTSRLATWVASPLLALSLLTAVPAWSQQVSVSINIAPPPLPVYVQPMVPGDGYLWTPGYWNWSPADQDYYWVPGTWVRPPVVGYLWTPGYWVFEPSGYRWRLGYWGRRVGFYGGINYGFGYTGRGYLGGRWNNGVFFYNRSVNNMGKVVIRNVYNTRVVQPVQVNRVSFNGGQDGLRARPTRAEEQEQKARHVEPTAHQVQHDRAALAQPAQRASVNHGAPQMAATPRATADNTPEVTRPARAQRNLPREAASATPRATRERPAAAAPAPDPARPGAEQHVPRERPTRPQMERNAAPVQHPVTQPAPRAEQRPTPVQRQHAERMDRAERPAAQDEQHGGKGRQRDER